MVSRYLCSMHANQQASVLLSCNTFLYHMWHYITHIASQWRNGIVKYNTEPAFKTSVIYKKEELKFIHCAVLQILCN